jgi:hypothetical protein
LGPVEESRHQKHGLNMTAMSYMLRRCTAVCHTLLLGSSQYDGVAAAGLLLVEVVVLEWADLCIGVALRIVKTASEWRSSS